MDMLTTNHRGIVDEGLKYVHNDTCYPALLVIGQLIDAVKHGGYDPHKVALFITQTGGGCRASNYIHLLRKALEKARLYINQMECYNQYKKRGNQNGCKRTDRESGGQDRQ